MYLQVTDEYRHIELLGIRGPPFSSLEQLRRHLGPREVAVTEIGGEMSKPKA